MELSDLLYSTDPRTVPANQPKAVCRSLMLCSQGELGFAARPSKRADRPRRRRSDHRLRPRRLTCAWIDLGRPLWRPGMVGTPAGGSSEGCAMRDDRYSAQGQMASTPSGEKWADLRRPSSRYASARPSATPRRCWCSTRCARRWTSSRLRAVAAAGRCSASRRCSGASSTGRSSSSRYVLIQGYRYSLSMFMGRTCRHAPSCSNFTRDAIWRHGFWPGGWMGLARIVRVPAGRHAWLRSGAGGGTIRRALVSAVDARALEIAQHGSFLVARRCCR